MVIKMYGSQAVCTFPQTAHRAWNPRHLSVRSRQEPASKTCADYSMMHSLLSMPSSSDPCGHIPCASQIKVQPLEVVRATRALLKKVGKSGGRTQARVERPAGSTVKVAPYRANGG